MGVGGAGRGRREPLSLWPAVQSLDWETFEQYCAWQLFLAHNIPLETIIPILQHLKYKGEQAVPGGPGQGQLPSPPRGLRGPGWGILPAGSGVAGGG